MQIIFRRFYGQHQAVSSKLLDAAQSFIPLTSSEDSSLLESNICNILNAPSNNVQKKVSKIGFRLSVSKTTCVHFQSIYAEPAIHLDGRPIPEEKEEEEEEEAEEEEEKEEEEEEEEQCIRAVRMILK
ncbi:hypothetical protein PoB_006561400 [Plakobranchus ocellatus]|uniref:Uncharacterized protein n=1 Tax=Plakobranchus ocellatus TaxID=259542 RepID=A0AAV4D4M7_9GAST|nr:hypothetical protein PoB_006561400 [Plakobranchus ocellatus]